jgi:hypothetical protein
MMDSIQPYQSGLMNYQGFAPTSSGYAEMQGTRVALASNQTRDITIYTDEGDKVTLSSKDSTLVYYSNYEGIFQEKSETGSADDPGGQISNQESIAFQQEFFMAEHASNISITVEGDLNKEEIKDIQNVLKRMDKIMNRSLSGKGNSQWPGKSLDARGFDSIDKVNMEYRYDQTMMISYFSVKEAVSYEQTGAPEEAAIQDPENALETDNTVDHMTSMIKDSGVSPYKFAEPVKSLFANILKMLNKNKQENEARIHMANFFESAVMDFINADDSSMV